jgi:signal transduction histidine kinase
VPATDKAADGFDGDVADQLRHDLKTPLSTISGRAQLLRRSVRNAAALPDAERVKMLDGLTAIERAVQELVKAIDGIGGPGHDERTDPSEQGR